MASRLAVSSDLPGLVAKTYENARALSKVIFTSSEVRVIHTRDSIPFQLHFCPSLAKKPNPPKNAVAKVQSEKVRSFNPFENPDLDMTIAHIPSTNPTHTLVLNKFPIIAEHFILITKKFKEQTQPLERGDLEATYAVLQAWENSETSSERRLFAFFNSGIESGASQPHRHVQLLPVESMKKNLNEVDGRLLIDVDAWLRSLNCWIFTRDIPADTSASLLHEQYTSLYNEAHATVQAYISAHPNEIKSQDVRPGHFSFSYNLAMTTSRIVLMPRRTDGTAVRTSSGEEVGFVALNGTLLGGSLMVKKQEEFDALTSRNGILDEIVEAIGIPKDCLNSIAAVRI